MGWSGKRGWFLSRRGIRVAGGNGVVIVVMMIVVGDCLLSSLPITTSSFSLLLFLPSKQDLDDLCDLVERNIFVGRALDLNLLLFGGKLHHGFGFVNELPPVLGHICSNLGEGEGVDVRVCIYKYIYLGICTYEEFPSRTRPPSFPRSSRSTSGSSIASGELDIVNELPDVDLDVHCRRKGATL